MNWQDKLKSMRRGGGASTLPEKGQAGSGKTSWPVIWHLAILLVCVISLVVLIYSLGPGD